MDDYQIAMFVLAGLPIIWGIVSTLRKRRKERLAEKEKRSPNLIGVHGSESSRWCPSCGKSIYTNRYKSALCASCGAWCFLHEGTDALVAYRYRKPSTKEVVEFVRSKDDGERR